MVRLGKKIRDLRRGMGLAQHELGSKIDVHQGQISKWESGKENPGAENAVKLANFFGISASELLALPGVPQDGLPTRRVTVVGEVAAGDWVESVEWPEDDQYQVPAPLPDSWADVPIHGFVVRGPSMNRIYPDGAVVYVAPLDKVANSPESGQVVLAIRQDAGGQYERTLKEYVVDENGKPWLWPRSSDPEHQAPLQFKKSGRDPDSVRIAGVVIAHFALSPILRRA